MARPKGLPKTGGRKPGSVNKTTSDLKAYAQTFTTEAIDGLVLIARDGRAPPAARVSAWNGVLDRGHGKPAQAITGPDGGPIRSESLVSVDPVEASKLYQKIMGS